MELPQLRAALHLLYYGASTGERHAADIWLRGFTSRQDRAWRVLAALLADGAAAEHERFFAAQQLRLSCQRQDCVLAPDSLAALAPLLAGQLAAAAVAGCRHTLNQLASALATLAVRSPSWPEHQVLPHALDLAREALRSTPGVDGERQQWVLLRLLSALAEAAASRGVGMRPERRHALLAALCASGLPLEAAQQALGPGTAGGGSCQAQAAALQLVQAWCGLGCPPAGAEACLDLWRHLHALVLHPELGGAAAEALAALHAACLAAGGTDGGDTRRERAPGLPAPGSPAAPHQHARLRQLLLHLLPGFGSALQQALARTEHPSQRAQLLFAALTLLGAAARSADAHVARCLPGADAAAAAAAAQLAADVALAALQQPQGEVVLAALQSWDEQLERWGGAGGGQPGAAQPAPASGACAPPQRRELLRRLCGALLQRMALPEGLPQHACTADARDLPDAVSKLRRELSDTFRSAAEALGAGEVRRQLLQLATQAAAAGAQLQQECCLYALNLVWGRQQAQQPRGEAAAETAAAAAAAAAALLPAAPKLAGTALTLLGGMAQQLVLLVPGDDEPQSTAGQAGQLRDGALLEAVLDRLLLLLQLPADPKLSRNAATCCHRLTGCQALAAALAARHPRWAHALCSCFAEAGGMRQPPSAGSDLTTPQFLLASICHLAAAAAHGAPTGSGDGPALLQRLLSQPAAAVGAALAAAAAAAPGSEAQREQLGCAAVQVEAIAVALEAAGGERRSDGSIGSAGPLTPHLPALLAGTARALQAAAAAAAACDAASVPRGCPPPRQPLVRAVCRVAAATSGTPAAAEGLALLRPLLASPPHPSLLAALSQLVAGGSGSDARRELEAAVGLSLRSAAAAHSADPDWQPALLALGTLCLQRLPAAAAAPASLDALLTTAWHSMRSYHRPACEAVLLFAEALCCVGCPPPRHPPAGSSPPDGTGSEPPWLDASAADAAAAAAAQQLRQRLDSGLGWQLVQGLLLAAAGSMPPYMVVLLADALHRTWLAVGTDRFGAWLRDAVQRAPEGEAPWLRWKPAAQAAAVGELLSPLCAADARRFKRLLKVFCGGKKKGQHVEQPARGG